MTKTLTEQWREGKLPDGFYYASIPGAVCGASILDDYELQAYKSVRDSDKIEVLSEVPSYSEYQALKDNCELTHTRLKGTHQKIDQLEKKLEIALEVLGIIAMHSKDPVDAVQAACAISQIKEMEGVK